MQLRFYSVLAGVSVLAAISATQAERLTGGSVMQMAQDTSASTPPEVRRTTATKTIGGHEFVSKIGVNTHIPYTDGGYANVSKVLEALTYLGVSNLRDSVPDPSLPGGGGSNFGPFAKAGFTFDFVVASNLPLTKTLSLLEDFAQLYPRTITAVEGPNEVNNWPITYKGRTGPDAAVEYQNDLFKAVKASPRLNTVSVYNLTSWPELFGTFDIYNAHTYPPKGEQPEAAIKSVMDQASRVEPKDKAVITEMGYYTLPGKGTWGGVDEPTQAKLMLNLILDSVDAGISKVYLYQLLDAYPDPAGTEMEKHFGLFDIAYRPKPAATAIRNLVRTVSAKGQDEAGGEPRTPNLTLSAEGTDVKHLLINGDGDRATLVLWNEPKIWDAEKNTALPVKPVAVTVDSQSELAAVEVFDPMGGAEPIQTFDKARSVTVQLEGYPKLVRFRTRQRGSD